MHHAIRRIAAVVLCAIAGCAQTVSPTGNRPKVGPHGGFAVRLPGDVGFGEVVIEVVPAGQGVQTNSQVVVYFLSADLTTAPVPLPTDVTVKLLFPDRAPETFALSAQPKADDPVGAGRFASPPAALLVDEPLGELTA